MKKIQLLFILLINLLFANEQTTSEDIIKYQKLIDEKQIIINTPYKSRFEVSNNNKMYIKILHSFFEDGRICGVFYRTYIEPDLHLAKKFSNFPNDFGGKVGIYKDLCFKYYKKPSYTFYDLDNKTYYLFEITPIDNKLIVNSKKQIKSCQDIRYTDPFEWDKEFYCLNNGKCYRLSYFLKAIEQNFPKNRNLIINLPNIECDLDIYFYSPNYVSKILVIDKQSNEIKDILYLKE
jgi:hypothetical protein